MGQRVHCIRYHRVRSKQSRTGAALRCSKFSKNRSRAPQSPVCDKRLVGGGRSKGLLRPVGCKRSRMRMMD
jgi:hypothetical protein